MNLLQLIVASMTDEELQMLEAQLGSRDEKTLGAALFLSDEAMAKRVLKVMNQSRWKLRESVRDTAEFEYVCKWLRSRPPQGALRQQIQRTGYVQLKSLKL